MDKPLTEEGEWTLFDQDQQPILPYGGTSGWSGTETSKTRATRQDSDGTTSKRQRDATRVLSSRGSHGVTWNELGQSLGLHHGSASGVLSTLHKAGVIARLSENRNGCQVYVLPQFILGRPTAPYKPNVSARLLADILTEIENDLASGNTYLARQRIHRTLETYGREPNQHQ